MLRSEDTPDVGILAPFVTPQLQGYVLWRALADAFYRMDVPGVSDDPHPITDDEFDARWSMLFSAPALRSFVGLTAG